VGHVESPFGPFIDSVSLVQDRSTVFTKRIITLENHFGRTRWNS
jgi:hypothetical protein